MRSPAHAQSLASNAIVAGSTLNGVPTMQAHHPLLLHCNGSPSFLQLNGLLEQCTRNGAMSGPDLNPIALSNGNAFNSLSSNPMVDRTPLTFSTVKKNRLNFMNVEEGEEEELMSSAMKRFCVSSESPQAMAAAAHLHGAAPQPFGSALPIAFLSGAGNANVAPTMTGAAMVTCNGAGNGPFGDFISESRGLFSPHSFACQLGGSSGVTSGSFSVDDLQSQIFANPIQSNPVAAVYGNPGSNAPPISAAISGVNGGSCTHDECRHELRCLHRHSSSAPDLRYVWFLIDFVLFQRLLIFSPFQSCCHGFHLTL
jgi:hypothetical protein